MRKVKFFLIACLMQLSIPLSAAEYTGTFQISKVKFDGVYNNLYFFTENGGWGSPSCPSAAHAWVESTVSGQNGILSVGLAAKMADRNVQFYGTCSGHHPDYFKVTDIILE